MDARKEEMARRLLEAGELTVEQIAGALVIPMEEMEDLDWQRDSQVVEEEDRLKAIRDRFYAMAMDLPVKTGDAAVSGLVKMLKLEEDRAKGQTSGLSLYHFVTWITNEIAKSEKLAKLNDWERSLLMGAVFDGIYVVEHSDWYISWIESWSTKDDGQTEG